MLIKDKNLLGESPIWNHLNNKFYWVDIDGKKIKSFDDFNILSYSLDKMPTCLALIDSNQIFTVVEDGLGIYDFRNNSYNYLHKIDDELVRFNDGKCDKNGILHIGTMCRARPRMPIGNIFKYENRNLIKVISDIGTSNGISFDKSNNMYYSDTSKKTIYRKVNKVIEIIYKYEDVGPDGSTIDYNNNYYSCLWGGSRIDIFNEGKYFDQINLDCKKPTCCCFGGQDMKKLFITSAYANEKDDGSPLILDTNSLGVNERVINFY